MKYSQQTIDWVRNAVLEATEEDQRSDRKEWLNTLEECYRYQKLKDASRASAGLRTRPRAGTRTII